MTDRFTTAQHDKTSEPLPLEEEFQGTSLAQRIWIGNVDLKVTEYTMVQILKKFGSIKQFDYLIHKTGPLQGQPRGFCFVSFEKEVDAARAILKLNNMKVLSRRIQVRWAHNQPQEKPGPKDTLKLPSDTDDATQPQTKKLNPNSSEAMIRAIEAKLNQMERVKSSSCPSSMQSSSGSQLHPALALSKQNAAAAKEASHPYYRRKRRRR
uniref:probable RNA-binding protein 18 n=1 Tax=Styela clava TaxID=7725 RepID=UPI00193A02CC|nr:probable RNA-binding protein 18 [Styela clava]